MSRWLFWLLVTLLSWGIWAILSRLIGEAVSPAQSQAVSTIGILPVIVALCLMRDATPPRNRRRGILVAFGSGLISGVGNIFYYAALNDAKASTVAPLTMLYPAVTMLLAVPVLKERITLLQWLGASISLLAIYLFNVPDERGMASPWLLLALVPVLLWGVTLLLQKMSTDDISGRESALWFMLAFVPLAGAILWWQPLTEGLTAKSWTLEAALGFTLAFGNLTILLAFDSGGKATVVGPLSGLYPLVSIPLAIVVLQEHPTPRTQLGIVAAIVAVLMLSIQPTPKPTGAAPI